MKRAERLLALIVLAAGVFLLLAPELAFAQKGIGIELSGKGAGGQEISSALKILLALTLLALIPGILVAMTAFTRIIIVLSMLRQALGMQEVPPNMVLVSLALFLTLFTMLPVVKEINDTAFGPYMGDKISIQEAGKRAIAPLREFMVRQTREQDLALMVELAKAPAPRTVQDIELLHLVPAFMLSEMRTAFQIGFVIFLPFLLIDLVVSSVLMSMGMLMVPPVVISLPIKILMFVLIDGWFLVVRSLVGSFH
jgi:flagellar biosynthetic protein FliP